MAEVREGTRRRLRAAARRGAGNRREGVGGERVRTLRRDAPGVPEPRAARGRAAGSAPRAVRRATRPVRLAGVRGGRPPTRPRLRSRPGRRAARSRRARAAPRSGEGARGRGARRRSTSTTSAAARSILLSRAGRVVRVSLLARRRARARTTRGRSRSTTSPASTRASCSSTRKLRFPKLHAARRLLQKKLGFRMTLDVVPLDAAIVRGSHGLAAADPRDRPDPHRPRPEPRAERADDARARLAKQRAVVRCHLSAWSRRR